MSRAQRLGAAVLCLGLAVTGCGSSDDDTLTGVVVDVVGDLTSVESFVLRLPDGTDRRLVPAATVTSHDGGAIGHLRDHLRNGEPVRVRYEIAADGTWIARDVEDAS